MLSLPTMAPATPQPPNHPPSIPSTPPSYPRCLAWFQPSFSNPSLPSVHSVRLLPFLYNWFRVYSSALTSPFAPTVYWYWRPMSLTLSSRWKSGNVDWISVKSFQVLSWEGNWAHLMRTSVSPFSSLRTASTLSGRTYNSHSSVKKLGSCWLGILAGGACFSWDTWKTGCTRE